jgi:elongator complex protein 2
VLLASASHDCKIRLWEFHDVASAAAASAAAPEPPGCDAPGEAPGEAPGDDDDELDIDALLGDAARLHIVPGPLLGSPSRVSHPVTLAALLVGHEESVTGVSWHPTATEPALLSASMDRTLLVWAPDESGVWLPVVRIGAAGGILGGR